MAVTPVTMASATKKEDRTNVKEAAATTGSSTTGSRLEVRSWEKLHPHGDVYSPRTGHTVTSKGRKDQDGYHESTGSLTLYVFVL